MPFNIVNSVDNEGLDMPMCEVGLCDALEQFGPDTVIDATNHL